jgi:hypothetical protein
VIIRKRIIEVEDKAIPVHLILGLDTVFSEILGYGRVVHTPMEGIRVVPCNQQKDCNKIGNFFITY